MTTDEGHEFAVKDGARDIKFTGKLIGHASSFSQGKSRWAEISIHVTGSGKYIVSGVGRSTVEGELDRHWAQVCERPHGVVERLHMVDDDDSRYIPRVSLRALEQAIMADSALSDAFLTETVE